MRKFAIVYFWYFLVLGMHGVTTAGPFTDRAECNKIRDWAGQQINNWNGFYYSECWNGNGDSGSTWLDPIPPK